MGAAAAIYIADERRVLPLVLSDRDRTPMFHSERLS